MNEKRAIELAKWGPFYARPEAKTHGEYLIALKYVHDRPELWDELFWSTLDERKARKDKL